jgi:hypothetical protein
MRRGVVVRFWGLAVGAAALFALLSALLLPFDVLGIHTAAERQRAWLLTLWTAGVLAILFGAAALLGAFGGIGAREVIAAGSVHEAVDREQKARRRWGGASFHTSFAWWTITTGALLIVIYFVAWIALR